MRWTGCGSRSSWPPSWSVSFWPRSHPRPHAPRRTSIKCGGRRQKWWENPALTKGRTMATPFAVQLDADHRRVIVGGQPMIFHCHHYNTYLQRTILDAEGLGPDGFLVGAGAEAAHHQLGQLLAGVDGVAAKK